MVQTALSELRSGDTPSRRAAAAHTLAALGDASLAPLLAFALHDEDADVHSAVEESMWALWLRSDDAEVDALMERGANSLRAAAVVGADALRDALAAFTEVTCLLPAFAEGHNKRATVLFLLKDFAESLAACERVLALNPHHFGALSGAGMCAANSGDEAASERYFAAALLVNPRLDAAREYVATLQRRRQRNSARRQQQQEGGQDENKGGDDDQSGGGGGTDLTL